MGGVRGGGRGGLGTGCSGADISSTGNATQPCLLCSHRLLPCPPPSPLAQRFGPLMSKGGAAISLTYIAADRVIPGESSGGAPGRPAL